MNIPKSALEPFGVIGIPSLNLLSMDICQINDRMNTVFTHGICFPPDSLIHILRGAALALGATYANCTWGIYKVKGTPVSRRYRVSMDIPNYGRHVILLYQPL
jgi:hypothetical protein